MSEMLEKVGARLNITLAAFERDVRISELSADEISELARAAIEAMATPTDAMVDAALEHSSGEGMPETVWDVMIAEALKVRP